MRPNPQAADPFGRPDLATRTTLIWASRTTATPGSVWPTRAGSDQAALDNHGVLASFISSTKHLFCFCFPST